jgi:hypothetical protein
MRIPAHVLRHEASSKVIPNFIEVDTFTTSIFFLYNTKLLGPSKLNEFSLKLNIFRNYN